MARATRRAVLFLITLAAAVAGCGGGDADEGGWITGLLDRIPDTGRSAEYVTVVDLAAAAAVGGVTAPGPRASDAEITAYLTGLPRDALIPDLFRDAFPDFESIKGELGIDPSLVTSAITAGEPPETFQVLTGEFDPAAVDQAVRAEPVWSDLLTTAEHGGLTYYTWGEDFGIDVDRVTPVRRLGRGGRLGLDDGYLYWVPWTAGMEGLIDAGGGGVPTLADDASLARVADALSGAGVYSAVMTDRALLQDTGASALAMGAGGGRDEAGPFWVIAAVHPDAAAAQSAAAEVQRILTEGEVTAKGEWWSERVSGATTTIDGSLMVVVVRSAGPIGDWWQAFATRDSVMLAAQG